MKDVGGLVERTANVPLQPFGHCSGPKEAEPYNCREKRGKSRFLGDFRLPQNDMERAIRLFGRGIAFANTSASGTLEEIP